MAKIFIATTTFGMDDQRPLGLLKEKGFEVVLNKHGRKLTEDELIELAKDCEGIIAGTEKYSVRVFESLPKLRAVSRCGVAMESVDMAAAERRGVKVANTPDAPTQAVAELALCLILDCLRKVSRMDRMLRKGEWKKESGSLLSGKTLGIVGLGRIGRRVAELAAPFKVKMLGADVKPDEKWLKKNGIELCALDELLAKSDIVTLHLPLTADNKGLINAERVKTMKKGAIIVNTARGGLIDERALFEALKSGALAGAALDVMEQEPYKGPLLELENIVLTPHIGAYAKEARIAMETEAVQNLLQLLSRGK